MSIIFSTLPKSDVISYTNLYWCEKTEDTYQTNILAANDREAHNLTCQECSIYGGALLQENLQVPDIQMSNNNALAFLKAFGMPVEYSGEVEASILFDSLTLLNLDSSDLIEADKVSHNVHSFGRDDSYINTRLMQFSKLTDWARKNNAKIIWS